MIKREKYRKKEVGLTEIKGPTINFLKGTGYLYRADHFRLGPLWGGLLLGGLFWVTNSEVAYSDGLLWVAYTVQAIS